MKAQEARELGHKVAFNFEDLKEKGEAYVAQIREQAQLLITQADQEAERIRNLAQQNGYENGRTEGFRDIEAEIQQRARELAQEEIDRRWQTTLPALEKLVQEVSREKESWIAAWERSAVKLSIAIAERIMRRQIQVHDRVPLEMVRESLLLASGQQELTVQIHPLDLEGLGNEIQHIQRMISPVGQIHFIPDANCRRGGCLIRTINGTIDARLETQLDRILAELIPEDPE